MDVSVKEWICELTDIFYSAPEELKFAYLMKALYGHPDDDIPMSFWQVIANEHHERQARSLESDGTDLGRELAEEVRQQKTKPKY